MGDESAYRVLRSDARLVVIEAPAGCGKTYQGAAYADDAAKGSGGKVLVLTHTHAACTVFVGRATSGQSAVAIRTIDSLLVSIASAYHVGLGLPADVPRWARENKHGYALVALRVSRLLKAHSGIVATLASRYPVVVCDEHQDCSGEQHDVAMALAGHGARVRVFGDPMQRIFAGKGVPGCGPMCEWDGLVATADAVERLDVPHRWQSGSPELGKWTLQARESLLKGGKVDLRGRLPAGVEVVFAENQARRHGEYMLSKGDRAPIDRFVAGKQSLLVLTRYNDTAQSLRSFFNRRIPLWEGHTRDALDILVAAVTGGTGDAGAVASAVVDFMNAIGKGFSASAFGNTFVDEARAGCVRTRKGKALAIQQIARKIVEHPNHVGVGQALLGIRAMANAGDFGAGDIEIDCKSEFSDVVHLGRFADIHDGLEQITHRRTYARPKPPGRALSTIHKAKGLECDSVVLLPCDANTLPNKMDARCLLYVALSRAKRDLLLVVSRSTPSPLLDFT